MQIGVLMTAICFEVKAKCIGLGTFFMRKYVTWHHFMLGWVDWNCELMYFLVFYYLSSDSITERNTHPSDQPDANTADQSNEDTPAESWSHPADCPRGPDPPAGGHEDPPVPTYPQAEQLGQQYSHRPAGRLCYTATTSKDQLFKVTE